VSKSRWDSVYVVIREIVLLVKYFLCMLKVAYVGT
jgi:DNA polymerase sigma